MEQQSNVSSKLRIGRWGVCTLCCAGAGALWAAFPAGLTTVVLSEPSYPSSASSYSSARIDGVLPMGQAGRSLAGGPDFNGDGFPDLVVGAWSADSDRGMLYVMYGNGSAPGSANLSSAVAISGAAQGDRLGSSMASADVTGDGITDLIVGASGVNSDTGAIYILPGGSSWTSSSVTAIAGIITIGGESSGGRFGSAVDAGDVTADGTSVSDGKLELLVGAPGAGKAYMIYGPVATGTVSSASSTNAYNYTFYGYAEDNVGVSVSVAGDLNADGSRDIVIGGAHTDATKTAGNPGGIAYLINGRGKSDFTNSGAIATMNLNATFNKKRNIICNLTYGTAQVGQLGAAAAGMGDINNDGYRDVILGAPNAAKSASTNPETGRIYLVFGSSTVFDTAVTTLSTSGFPYYYGDTAYDHLGGTLGRAGDIDNDGYGDVLAGAPSADLDSVNPGDGYGAAYLIGGRKSADWPTSSGALVSSSPNIKFSGKYRYDFAGSAAYGNGRIDLDADGYGDFFISSPGYDITTDGDEGRVYFVSFGDFYDKDGDGQSKANGDCNDADPEMLYTANGSNEVCDGKDNDCDGLVDDEDDLVADQNVYYPDVDGDTYGGEPLYTCASDIPAGYIVRGGDCDDANAALNPDATEVCDGIDNDCDGAIDDEDGTVTGQNAYYGDADGDGYGSVDSGTIITCNTTIPEGYSTSDKDCNDVDATQNPTADEFCDGVDTNCNGNPDDNPVDGTIYYEDADSDGYGNPDVAVSLCAPEVGYADNLDDCNDLDSFSYPGALEQCDGFDNNCDGAPDEDVSAFDQDGDGYLDEDQCAAYGDNTDQPLDCDDTNPSINPGATEDSEDGVDNDCDGRVDESTGGCGGQALLDDASRNLRGGQSTGRGLLFGAPATFLFAGLVIRRRRNTR